MVRKTKEETQRTRDQILKVALSVFAERGYSRASLQVIAEGAGFTRGAVYWHFKNKAELFMALSKDIANESDKLFVNPNGVKCIDELCKILCSYLALLESDKRLGTFYKVAYYQMEWTEDLEEIFEDQRQELRDLYVWIFAIIKKLHRKRLIARHHNPKPTSLCLHSMFNGIIATWIADPTFVSLKSDGTAVITSYLSSLAPLD